MKRMARNKNPSRPLLIAWLVVFAAIVVASLIPEDLSGRELLSNRWWNWGHMPAYALLACMTVLLVARLRRVTVGLLLAVGAGVGAIGLLIEVVQPFFGRTLSVTDFAFNLLGVAIALLACFLMRDSGLFGALPVNARQ